MNTSNGWIRPTPAPMTAKAIIRRTSTLFERIKRSPATNSKLREVSPRSCRPRSWGNKVRIHAEIRNRHRMAFREKNRPKLWYTHVPNTGPPIKNREIKLWDRPTAAETSPSGTCFLKILAEEGWENWLTTADTKVAT